MPYRVRTAAAAKFRLMLLALAIGLSAASPLFAQVRFVGEALPTAVSETLQKGQTLELERRWGEALSHYEEAVRIYPNERALQERLDLARIHYDLGRRYNDLTFRKSLQELDGQQALDLYAEVLLKINTHYVTVPQWQEIVARGTTCLDVALGEKAFLEQNGLGATTAALEAFRRQIHATVSQHAVRSRHDARQCAELVAQLAGRSLGLSATAVALEYTCGAMGGLDDYSAFLSGGQLRDVYAQIDGNFVGLGIELKAHGGRLTLVGVIPGSPAARAGMQAGDAIVAVDGRSTVSMSTDAAASLLQGEEGSVVEVSVARAGGQVLRLRVRREQVEVPSVEHVSIVDKDLGVGYFKLNSFQKTTLREVDRALWNLHRDGMRSLIIDLRGNPGGLLTAAVELADKFLQQGTIVSTRGRSPQEDFNYTAHQAGTWQVPLVVLIDGNSASASEIFAGAMLDNHRGTLVGDRSYGKGSVQGIFPLAYAGAGVRLTTAKFYSPNGRPISKVGVQPDIVVRHAAKATEGVLPVSHAGQDAVLQAGLRAARQQLAAR